MQSGECGISYSGQEYSEIPGLNCARLGQMKNVDDKEYNLVGKVNGEIVFGSEDGAADSSSETTRPTALSMNPLFKKVVN